MESYKIKIKRVLESAPEPLDVEKIRTRAGIGGWNTALKHCLELVMNSEIEGIRTSNGWVFYIKKKGQLFPSIFRNKINHPSIRGDYS